MKSVSGRKLLDIPEVRCNTACVFGANTIASISQLAQYLLFVYFYGKSEAGNYALQVAFITPFFLLASFQQRRILATSSGRNGFGVKTHLLCFATSHALIIVMLSGVYAFVSDFRTFLIAILIVVMRLQENATEAVFGYFQQYGEYSKLLWSRMFHATLQVATIVFCSNLRNCSMVTTLLSVIVIRIVTSMIIEHRSALLLLISSTKEEKERLNQDELVEAQDTSLLATGFSLGGGALLASISSNFPQYVMGLAGMVDQIAVFVILSRLSLIGANVARAINEAFARPITECVATHNFSKFRRILIFAARVDLCVGIAVLVGVQAFFSLFIGMAGVGYSDVTRLDLVFVFFSMIVNNLMGLSFLAMTVLRKCHVVFTLQFISLCVIAVFSAVLVPVLGLSGGLMCVGLGKVPSLLCCISLIDRESKPFVSEGNERGQCPV